MFVSRRISVRKIIRLFPELVNDSKFAVKLNGLIVSLGFVGDKQVFTILAEAFFPAIGFPADVLLFNPAGLR